MANDERELENNFIYQYAQTLRDEDTGEMGVSKADLQDAANILDSAEEPAEQPPDVEAEKEADAEGLFPTKDPDEAEARAVEKLIPWENFSINYDPYYAQERINEQLLPLQKAKSKSFYIFFAPENKRLEGIHNKRLVGGYGTKEELGEDLAWLKSEKVGSPEGFPPEWKESLLKDMHMPPAIEADSKTEAQKEQKELQQVEAEEGSAKQPAPAAAPATKAPEPNIPAPVGKASPAELANAAGLNQLNKRRILRAELLKKL